MDGQHRGLLYALVACLMSATSAIIIKSTSVIPLATLLFARFFIAFLFVIPTIIQRKIQLRMTEIPKHFLRGLAGLTAINCYFYTVTSLPLVNAVTLSNTKPLFVPLVIFLATRHLISRFKMVGLILGFCGVLLLLKPTVGFMHHATVVGLIGGFAGAVSLVGIRQLSKSESTQTIMAYYFLISIIILFLPMIFTWKPLLHSMDWVYLFLLGVTSAFYQFCLTKALTYTQPTKVSSVAYLSVLFSGFTGWAIFGEVPTGWIIAGGSLIILGGFITIVCSSPAKKI